MKASAQRQEPAGAQPAIKPIGEIAPVVPSAIVNKNNIATDEQVTRFCRQVEAGKPTGKIFPTKMSEMEFSLPQREAIAQARKAHKVNCIQGKKALIKVLQSKSTKTYAHKTNREGLRGRIGYVKDAMFAGKDGKFSETAFTKFVDGPKPKAATA